MVFMVFMMVMVIMVIAMIFLIGVKGEGVDERLAGPVFREALVSLHEGEAEQNNNNLNQLLSKCK